MTIIDPIVGPGDGGQCQLRHHRRAVRPSGTHPPVGQLHQQHHRSLHRVPFQLAVEPSCVRRSPPILSRSKARPRGHRHRRARRLGSLRYRRAGGVREAQGRTLVAVADGRRRLSRWRQRLVLYADDNLGRVSARRRHQLRCDSLAVRCVPRPPARPLLVYAGLVVLMGDVERKAARHDSISRHQQLRERREAKKRRAALSSREHVAHLAPAATARVVVGGLLVACALPVTRATLNASWITTADFEAAAWQWAVTARRSAGVGRHVGILPRAELAVDAVFVFAAAVMQDWTIQWAGQTRRYAVEGGPTCPPPSSPPPSARRRCSCWRASSPPSPAASVAVAPLTTELASKHSPHRSCRRPRPRGVRRAPPSCTRTTGR